MTLKDKFVKCEISGRIDSGNNFKKIRDRNYVIKEGARYTNCYGEQDEGVKITDDGREQDSTILELPPSEKGYMIMISRKLQMHWVIDDRNCPTEW